MNSIEVCVMMTILGVQFGALGWPLFSAELPVVRRFRAHLQDNTDHPPL